MLVKHSDNAEMKKSMFPVSTTCETRVQSDSDSYYEGIGEPVAVTYMHLLDYDEPRIDDYPPKCQSNMTRSTSCPKDVFSILSDETEFTSNDIKSVSNRHSI